MSNVTLVKGHRLFPLQSALFKDGFPIVGDRPQWVVHPEKSVQLEDGTIQQGKQVYVLDIPKLSPEQIAAIERVYTGINLRYSIMEGISIYFSISNVDKTLVTC